jgi:nucleotide-binding universal stress UspA family protein
MIEAIEAIDADPEVTAGAAGDPIGRPRRGPVLVPLDGSALAERALPWGVRLAARRGVPLLLAQAVRPPYAVASGPATATLVGHLLEAELATAEAYLEGEAAAVRAATPGLEVRTAVRPGDPATVLLGLEEDEDVRLVVMGTHGRSGLDRWVRGSVAEAVLCHGMAPVLLVRPTDDPARATGLGREGVRLLVPLDGSALAAGAVQEAARIVAPGGGEIMFATVVPLRDRDAAPGSTPVGDPTRAAAQRHLEEAAVALRRRGLRATAVVLTADDPAAAIVDLATLEEIDLIVMATHGRGGLGRWLYGSVADTVSRTARTPVLLVRPAGARSRSAGDGLLATRLPAGHLAAGRI